MDRSRIELSESQVFQALQQALLPTDNGGDPEAMTVRELSRAIGRSREVIRVALQDLVDDGKVESVWVRRNAICGSPRPVPAYVWVKEEGDEQ